MVIKSVIACHCISIHARISIGTLGLTERRQIGLNQYWEALHVGEHTSDGCRQFGDGREETIVGSRFARVLPKAFCGIQFRTVGR